MELREGAADAELFRVTGVNTRNEGADEAIEELAREFPADEGGDGFVAFRRNAISENIADECPFRGDIDQRAGEERGRTHRHNSQLAIDQDIAWSVLRGFEKLVHNAKIRAQAAQLRTAGETLRAKLQQETVMTDRADDATGTLGSLHKKNVDARFLERVGAD